MPYVDVVLGIVFVVIAFCRYMSAKRGLEKPPFKLPDYIESTGTKKQSKRQKSVGSIKKYAFDYFCFLFKGLPKDSAPFL